ncbi:MAG: hypothetical protein IJI14_13455 [Anaerolineaceae bacterium]|nr:hypothetical protein [Anaerolineaceae bacterium]
MNIREIERVLIEEPEIMEIFVVMKQYSIDPDVILDLCKKVTGIDDTE